MKNKNLKEKKDNWVKADPLITLNLLQVFIQKITEKGFCIYISSKTGLRRK